VAWGDGWVGALNGVLGDYLDRRGNALAVDMGLVHGGQALPLDAAALRRAYLEATSKIVLFVHGLCCTEQSWDYPERRATTYGSQLQQRCGMTPLFVRYNTGLHISRNGRQLADLLDELSRVYPAEIGELTLVGHSMGGLLIRSACHYGAALGHGWLGAVRRAIYLGSPHAGAPLEKAGGLLSLALAPIDEPVTKLTRTLVNLRSAGIKDLRHANLVDEDWEGRDPDVSFQGERAVIPLPDHISHHAVAGTLTENERHLVAQLIGDAMVRVPSAAGGVSGDAAAAGFGPDACRLFPGLHHMALAHHPDVYDQIEAWCGRAMPATVQQVRDEAGPPLAADDEAGRAKGVKDLAQDAVEHGSAAVQAVHETIAARPFRVLEMIPPIQLPVRGVRLVHDAVVRTVYGSIRLVNRAAGAVADHVITTGAEREGSAEEPDEPERK